LNERNTTGGAKDPSKEIWNADEVKDVVVDKSENRMQPEFDVIKCDFDDAKLCRLCSDKKLELRMYIWDQMILTLPLQNVKNFL
jgi:hypothetical protein